MLASFFVTRVTTLKNFNKLITSNNINYLELLYITTTLYKWGVKSYKGFNDWECRAYKVGIIKLVAELVDFCR